MNLVVFDIDGTLTRTNEADEKCFQTAVAEKFGIPGVVTDWGAYTHSTDSGIIQELVETKLGRAPTQEEIDSFKQIFIKHLENFYATVPGSFDCVPGACTIFNQIKNTGTHVVSLATGGWKPSALMKLGRAQVDVQEVPAAFADDHFSRDDIIKTSVERAKQRYGVDTFRSITYVGDGRWDFVTCKRLGIPFIGVTDKRGRDYLSREGVETIIDDYSDFDSFFRLLNRKII